ncbi:MAG: hypothetical protein PUD42_03890 [Clostridiales bacterium]|nr:hypothetical protein [Clostridiales bacterium]
MNNVKRIIAAGLVGTAVISTGVVASAEEAQLSPQQKLQAIMAQNGVNDALQQKLLKIADVKVLNDAEAEKILNNVNTILDAYESHNYSFKELQNDKDAFTAVQKAGQKAGNTLGLTYTTADGVYSIFDEDDNLVASFTKSEFGGLLGTTEEAKKEQIANLKSSIMPELTTYMKLSVADRTKVPEKPITPDPKPTPTPDTPATETPDTPFTPGDSTTTQEYVDAVNKLEAGKDWNDEQVKALEDIKKLVTDMLENGFNLDQLNQAEALLAKLPADSEQYKTLKATIDYLKTYKNNDGQTAGDAQVEATKTPSNDNNSGSATSGTTAKTATNFGNVAVAGLGLMTVAGTVFVISKKKIQ